MNRYLVDSNILIDNLRGFQPVKSFLDQLSSKPDSRLYISIISETEIFAGQEMQKDSSRQKAKLFLDKFLKILLDSRTARLAGDLVREEELEVIDALIAATALKEDLILITRNLKHFKKVKNLKILSP